MWEKKGLIYKTVKSNLTHASIPFADIIDNNTIRIYFSSRNLKGQSLPFYIETDSSDLSRIKYINEKPLLEFGPVGTFDDSGIMPSCITSLGNGKKYLYYIAWNVQVSVPYRLSIGLAISEDEGKSFKKASSGPILDRDFYEPYFNTAPFVILEGKKWRMWYVSTSEWKVINGKPEPKYHIRYAESDDGIFWKRTGIVCIDYCHPDEAIGRPCIIYEGNIYRMWYSYRSIIDYRDQKNNGYRIGYAESGDGLKWFRKDSLAQISVSMDGWDSNMIEYCHVINIHGIKHMLYNGNGFGYSGFGYAIEK